MRVSTRTIYQGNLRRILELSSELNDINKKISSGKKITSPSDDPIAFTNSMGLKTAISQIEQYSRNMQTGESWLEMSESAISQALDLLSRAQEIATEMANSTQSAETRMSAATEVDQLLDEAIALGNSQLGGSYIFAGYQTSAAPFSKTTSSGIDTASYDGDTNDFQIQIGKDEFLTVGKNGQEVFMDSGIFDILGTLKQALEDNDQDAISQQLDSLGEAEDYLNNQIADVGARANRLERKESILEDLSSNLTERLSEVEDADIAEVVIELEEMELAYQAALQASTQIMGISILNYLG